MHPPGKTATSKRITLTKAQALTSFGVALCGLLQEIGADGDISVSDLNRLRQLLETGPENLNCVGYLRQIINTILLDGVITPLEMYELRYALERVLPKPSRLALQEKFGGPAENLLTDLLSTADDDEYDAEPERPQPPIQATEKQVAYIQKLGGTAPAGMTKSQASDLIDILKSCRPASPRQLMVLRFWNRMDLAELGREAASSFMDELYATKPECLEAWEQFKSDVGDFGQLQDPNQVELGLGYSYLKRPGPRGFRAPAISVRKNKRRKGGKSSLSPFVVGLGFIVFGAVMIHGLGITGKSPAGYGTCGGTLFIALGIALLIKSSR